MCFFLKIENASVNEKVLGYNLANREVAILCNHQRSLPKKFGEQMAAIDEKVFFHFHFRFFVILFRGYLL